MRIQWTSKGSSDLVRLYEHLKPVAPEAAARDIQQLARAPGQLLDFPRLGKRLDVYEPRETRRRIVANYKMRYELATGTIFMLRVWFCRDSCSFESET